MSEKEFKSALPRRTRKIILVTTGNENILSAGVEKDLMSEKDCPRYAQVDGGSIPTAAVRRTLLTVGSTDSVSVPMRIMVWIHPP